MNLLERINRNRILLKAFFKLNQAHIGRLVMIDKPLIFMDMGIGNIVHMKHVVNYFKNPVCVAEGHINKLIIKRLYPHARVISFNEISKVTHNPVCICNFLNQKKWQIKLIIKHKIMFRVGHICGKWDKIFNYNIDWNEYEDEIQANENLLTPFKNEYSNISDRNP